MPQLRYLSPDEDENWDSSPSPAPEPSTSLTPPENEDDDEVVETPSPGSKEDEHISETATEQAESIAIPQSPLDQLPSASDDAPAFEAAPTPTPAHRAI